MTKKNQHVVPHEGGWAVRKEGSKKVTRKTRTQQEAIEVASDCPEPGFGSGDPQAGWHDPR